MTCRATLVQRPEFCLVVHRLRRSCGGFKAEGLETNYPGLCSKVRGEVGRGLCDQEGRHLQEGAPTTTNQRQGETVCTSVLSDLSTQLITVRSLVKQIFQYSRDNLALVNVYIKNPVVTKIRWSQFNTLSNVDPHATPGEIRRSR